MLTSEIKDLLHKLDNMKCGEYFCSQIKPWEESKNPQIIFKEHLGVELGGPLGSFSLTTINTSVVDGRCIVVGKRKFQKSTSWARISLVALKEDFRKVEQYYHYLQKLNLIPVRNYMQGVMIRIQPSKYQEWIKIKKGYQNRDLLSLIARFYYWYKTIDFVDGIEFIIINTSFDMKIFEPLIDKYEKIKKAFEKRFNEHIRECDDCDNREICKEIDKQQGY